MILKRTEKHSPVYSLWFGQPVVLQVRVRQCLVPIHCSIVDESGEDVRIRIQPGWEMDIRKDLILAVEDDFVGLGNRIN